MVSAPTRRPPNSAAGRRRPSSSSIHRERSSSSWGGPGEGYDWPESPGGIAVDAKGMVWIAAAGFPDATPRRRPRRARRANRDAATPAQAGRCARPAIHAHGQVRAADRQAGRDRGEREPDVAQSPCRARHRCRGERALRRRRPRQPPHRRVRRHERRVQAALGRLRRRARRCDLGRVRSGGAAGEAVPDGQLRDDRQKRPGLRLRSAEQPHPGVRQERQVRQGSRRGKGDAGKRRGLGHCPLGRLGAAIPVCRRWHRPEGLHPAARHA